VIKGRTLWIFLLSTLAIGISNAREPADAHCTIDANVNPAEETTLHVPVPETYAVFGEEHSDRPSGSPRFQTSSPGLSVALALARKGAV